MARRKSADVRKCDFKNSMKNFFVICSYVVIVVAFMGSVAFADGANGAAYSDVFAEASSIFDYLCDKILELSIGAVIIAVGIGVFMRKFSMGKQDKIEAGNNLIRNSLIGFVFLQSMPVIVKTMKGLINGTISK